MTSGHYCHRDTVKIDNSVTSRVSVALVSITFLHSHVVTYSVFLRCKDQSRCIIPTRRNKAKGFCGAPAAHSSSFITPSLGAVRLQIAASDQSHHTPLGWGCLFSCLFSLTLSLSITCWMIPCAGTEKKEGRGKWGVAGWRNRRDPPRNLSPSPYTLVHNRSQSRSDQIGGSNSWFGMCAVPHRLL